MRHATFIGVLILALTLFATRSEAGRVGLGCFDENENDNEPGIATCGIAADCAPVGGTDCTNGACLCTGGAQVPFCACASAAAPAPVLSAPALVGLIGLLGAVGAIGILRRKGSGRRTPV